MCEANVYLVNEDGKKTLLIESVDKILPKEDGLHLENIFGERKTIKAKIIEMALVEHSIFIKKDED